MSQSPLEKYRSQGFGAMSPIELIAVALAREDDDSQLAMAEAGKVIKSLGGIRQLASASPSLLMEAGLSSLEAAQFACLVELGRRGIDTGKGGRPSITDPADVYHLFKSLRDEPQEHFCAVLLDVKNTVLKTVKIHKGTLSASVVGVREFYREAIREGAASVIAVHNHPSGDPTPSKEDIEVTRVLKEAGKLLEIPLLDHIIIGENDWRSLQQMGAMG